MRIRPLERNEVGFLTRLLYSAAKRQVGTTRLRTRALSPLADRFLIALRRVASRMA